MTRVYPEASIACTQKLFRITSNYDWILLNFSMTIPCNWLLRATCNAFFGCHSTRSPGFGQTLLQKIQAVKPKAHLFGHIHESRQGSSVRNFLHWEVVVCIVTQVEDGRDATPQRRKRVGVCFVFFSIEISLLPFVASPVVGWVNHIVNDVYEEIMRFVMFLKRLPGLISLPQLMSWGGSRQAFHGGSEYAEALADDL